MKLHLESLNRSESSVEIVSANTAEPLEIETTGRFAVLKCGAEVTDAITAELRCEDMELSDSSKLEEIMAPLAGTMATLNPDGSISYDFESTFAEMNCEGHFGEVSDDSPDSVFFGSDWEIIEQEDMLAPFCGMIATLNADGTIFYASSESMSSDKSENIRQSIHHAPRTSLSEPETVVLAR